MVIRARARQTLAGMYSHRLRLLANDLEQIRTQNAGHYELHRQAVSAA